MPPFLAVEQTFNSEHKFITHDNKDNMEDLVHSQLLLIITLLEISKSAKFKGGRTPVLRCETRDH